MKTNNLTKIQENKKLFLFKNLLKNNSMKTQTKYFCFKELDILKRIIKQGNLFVVLKSEENS